MRPSHVSKYPDLEKYVSNLLKGKEKDERKALFVLTEFKYVHIM